MPGRTVVAYIGDASVWCPKCAKTRYEESKKDYSGQDLMEVLAGDEWDDRPVCDDCGDDIKHLMVANVPDEDDVRPVKSVAKKSVTQSMRELILVANAMDKNKMNTEASMLDDIVENLSSDNGIKSSGFKDE